MGRLRRIFPNKIEIYNNPRMQLRVRAITYLAEAINGYEFVDPRGRDLPRFEAGAHVELRIGGLLRQYSLCNDPAERRRYGIAVLRETGSRGGSRHLHESVRAGDIVEISLPRNNFPLDWTAQRHLLIAGGIGIAPMMSMISELRRRRAEFKLYYCTRSPERTAFRKELAPLHDEKALRLHHDGGDIARSIDIAAVVRDAPPGTHLYYCGPAPLMTAVGQAARDWPAEMVHCEYFTAVPPPLLKDDHPFRVRLARSGREYEVAVGETIVDVLRRHNVAVRTSCEFGYCGACLTPYLDGEPDHRDQMLGEDARRCYALICCARSKTPVLELDL